MFFSFGSVVVTCKVHMQRRQDFYSDVVKYGKGPMVISLSILSLKYLHMLAIRVYKRLYYFKKIIYANLFPVLSKCDIRNPPFFKKSMQEVRCLEDLHLE